MFSLPIAHKPWLDFACSFAFSVAQIGLSLFEAGVVFITLHCCIGPSPKFTCRTCDPETQIWLAPSTFTFITETKEKGRKNTIKRVIITARHAAMFTFSLWYPDSHVFETFEYSVHQVGRKKVSDVTLFDWVLVVVVAKCTLWKLDIWLLNETVLDIHGSINIHGWLFA